jgi:hypothetical protein
MKVLDGLDLANQQLKNLADGSLATDAVTLQQLQAYVRGLDWKESVRAASTANVNVAAPGASIDGVTLATNDRVLLKNQSTGSQNGLYQFNGSAVAMTRTLDASTQDGIQTLTAGSACLVTEGTVNADTAWVLTTNDPITVGTTSLSYAQFGGGTTYTNGNGLDLTGTTFSVKAATGGGITVAAGGVSIDFTKAVAKYAANVGDGSTTTFTITHSLGSSDVIVGLRNIATGVISYMSPTIIDTNSLSLAFPSAPTSGQYRVVVHA